MKKTILFSLIVLMLLLGCSQQEKTTPTSTITISGETTAKTYNIKIENSEFIPNSITIKRGDTIIWTNTGSVKHTITSDAGDELDSELVAKGQSYSHKFDEAGEFSYHCTPHPYMKATVIVE